MQDTATFEDMDGKTRLTIEILLNSKEELDMFLNMGVEQGTQESWDKLEAYLAQ